MELVVTLGRIIEIQFAGKRRYEGRARYSLATIMEAGFFLKKKPPMANLKVYVYSENAIEL
jgi:hypothetical protein